MSRFVLPPPGVCSISTASATPNTSSPEQSNSPNTVGTPMTMSDFDVAELWEAIFDYRSANSFAETKNAHDRLKALIDRFAKRQPSGDDKALAYLKLSLEREPRGMDFAKQMLKDVFGLMAREAVVYDSIG